MNLQTGIEWAVLFGFVHSEIQQKAPAKFSLTGALAVIPLGLKPPHPLASKIY